MKKCYPSPQNLRNILEIERSTFKGEFSTMFRDLSILKLFIPFFVFKNLARSIDQGNE